MFTARYELKIQIYLKLIFFFKGLKWRREVFPLQATKAFKEAGRVQVSVWLQSFLISTQDGGEWSVPRRRPLCP
jgi:hypothetical protein